MGWPLKLRQRQAITWQAATRLLVSLSLLVIALSFSSALIYKSALGKAAHERAENLQVFYQSRLAHLERDWEMQTRDFKTRIEFTRHLEHPRTADINLHAFFTIQGERYFTQLLVFDKTANIRFQLNKQGVLANPLKRTDVSGWYLDKDAGQLYRIFQENIWLGKDGAGKMLAYYPIDNALLFQLATPGVNLAARYQNELVASSIGSAGIANFNVKSDAREHSEVQWAGNEKDPLSLLIDAPLKEVFSTLEISLGIGMIPVVDALILWFVLGTWLMLQARRIKAMGVAVEEFARHNEITPSMQSGIRIARQSSVDEIHDVSVAIETLAQKTIQHRDNLEERVAGRTAALEMANQKLIRQSDRLIASEAELHRAQAVAKIGSWRLSVRENSLNWSEETYRIFGVAAGTAISYEMFLSLVHKEDRSFVDRGWQAALRGEPYNIEHRIVARGVTKWVREQAELEFDRNGVLKGGIGTVQDITELKQYEQKIEQMAYFDTLTQLPNRRMLYDRLSHTVATGKRSGLFSALMFIDLDNFKPLNDRYGHVAGDLLLMEVARRLAGCVRETDTVSRFGGDEFVVLLSELDKDEDVAQGEALAAAEKIRSTLAQAYVLEAGGDGKLEVEHHCTPSIGVVMFCGVEEGIDEILNRADEAMYRAKAGGRNLIRLYEADE